MVPVGDEIEVEVLDVDLDKERISLSLKATQTDPWQEFADTHQVGELVYGRITKLVPFGAFVQVGDGIEGLVHISEMAAHHVDLPEQVVTPGEELWVKIIDIDLQRRRISLSIKQAAEGGEVSEEYREAFGEHAYDDEGNYIGTFDYAGGRVHPRDRGPGGLGRLRRRDGPAEASRSRATAAGRRRESAEPAAGPEAGAAPRRAVPRLPTLPTEAAGRGRPAARTIADAGRGGASRLAARPAGRARGPTAASDRRRAADEREVAGHLVARARSRAAAAPRRRSAPGRRGSGSGTGSPTAG